MSHTVELGSPISCAVNGDKQDINFVELFSPNYKQIDKYTPIKQAVTKAFLDFGDENKAPSGQEKPEDIELKAEHVMMLLMKSDCDMTKIFLHFAELFKSGTALVGGEIKFTQPLLDSMPINDFEKLAGEYIANFILPSLMDGI